MKTRSVKLVSYMSSWCVNDWKLATINTTTCVDKSSQTLSTWPLRLLSIAASPASQSSLVFYHYQMLIVNWQIDYYVFGHLGLNLFEDHASLKHIVRQWLGVSGFQEMCYSGLNLAVCSWNKTARHSSYFLGRPYGVTGSLIKCSWCFFFFNA